MPNELLQKLRWKSRKQRPSLKNWELIIAAAACEAAGVDVNHVEDLLEEAGKDQPDDGNWSEQSLASLVSHIVEKHHAYCREEGLRLQPLLAKVVSKHGGHHPELAQVQDASTGLPGVLYHGQGDSLHYSSWLQNWFWCDQRAIGRRYRRPIAKRRVRASRVIFHPRLLDHDLRFLQGIEDFSIQAFISQLAVEALAVAVLPRASGLDVQCSGAQAG